MICSHTFGTGSNSRTSRSLWPLHRRLHERIWVSWWRETAGAVQSFWFPTRCRDLFTWFGGRRSFLVVKKSKSNNCVLSGTLVTCTNCLSNICFMLFMFYSHRSWSIAFKNSFGNLSIMGPKRSKIVSISPGWGSISKWFCRVGIYSQSQVKSQEPWK